MFQFTDGAQLSNPILAKFCNNSQPSLLTSAGGDVAIHFHSDDKDNFGGFQIVYSIINGT